MGEGRRTPDLFEDDFVMFPKRCSSSGTTGMSASNICEASARNGSSPGMMGTTGIVGMALI